MKTAVIIDGIVAVVLLGFLIHGAWRGLFQAVAGLVIVVLALGGGGIAARTLTPAATEVMRPVIEGMVTTRVDNALGGNQPSGVRPGEITPEKPNPTASSGDSDPLAELQASELLKLMGLDDNTVESLADKVGDKVRDTGVSIATAVTQSMMESIIYMVLFTISTAALLLLLTILARAMGLVMKLPGISLLNGLGGAAVGLIEGALLLFLAVWLLRCAGVSFETETVTQTRILEFFTTRSPLDLLAY